MAYSAFTLQDLESQFGLTVEEVLDLHPGVAEAALSPTLTALLEIYVPLALSIHTEKARSELIVAPLLVEVREQLKHQVSLFSGVEFPVDPDRGLTGTCDFILSRTSFQLFVRAPILTVVEAKNDSLKSGHGQCAAAMLAAQMFNERAGIAIPGIHGAVTTGSHWQFLHLSGKVLKIGVKEYNLPPPGEVLGILLNLARG